MMESINGISASEREMQTRLETERLEYLVDKVEGEVEFEGMMEEMCVRLKADDEVMDLERREKEWEMERREVRFEEEIAVLKNTVYRLEEELKVAQEEKELAMHEKQEEINKATWTTLVELHKDNRDTCEVGKHAMEQWMQALLKAVNIEELETGVDSPRKTIAAALENALRAADERVEIQRQECEEIKQLKESLERNFHDEWQRWTSREEQLKTRVSLLEMEISRLSALIQEKDSLIELERERRAEVKADAEAALDAFKEEKKVHNATLGKLQKVENFVCVVKEKMNAFQEISKSNNVPNPVGKLEEILKDLVQYASEISFISTQKKDSDHLASTQTKLMERWKAQRDSALREREHLEEKLSLLLRRARDREAEIEAMWSEREKTLMEKVHAVQESSYRWETKYKKRESELFHERKQSEDRHGSASKDSMNGKSGLDGTIRGKKQWSKGQEQRSTPLSEPNQSESQAISLMPSSCYCERMDDSMSQMNPLSGKGESLMYNRDKMDECQGSSAGSSESQGSSSKVLLVVQETVNRDNEAESCAFVQQSTRETEEAAGPTKAVRVKEGKVEKNQAVVNLEIELLREERKELEKRFSENLLLMEDRKRDIEEREHKMEQERNQLEMAISQKAAELEQMKTKLILKEKEIDIIQQKFRNEVQFLEEEVEKERKERQQIMDLHFVSKKLLVDEMDLKQEKQEEEMDGFIQDLQKLRKDIGIKDQEKQKLEEKYLALMIEKEQWEMVARKQNPEVAGLLQKVISENEALHQKLKWEQNAGTLSRQSSIRLVETVGEKEFYDLRETEKEVSRWLHVSGCCEATDDNSKDAEWQSAVGKVATFEKQIREAMHAVEKLREELCAKESELLKARTEPELDLTSQEAARLQSEKDRADEWLRKEDQLNMEKEELLKLLEAERSEAADSISSLHGIIRELKWSLMRYQENITRNRGSDFSHLEIVQKPVPNTEVVKVHTSHLEELDQYILDLKSKLEDSEKKLRSAEAALSAQTLNNAVREERLDAALKEMEKEIISIGEEEKKLLLPAVRSGTFAPHYQQAEPFSGSEIVGYYSELKPTNLSRKRGTLRSILRHSLGSVNMPMQEASPGPTKAGYDQHVFVWNSEVGKGSDANVAENAGLNITKEAVVKESWRDQDCCCEGQPAFSFPPRRQRRWVVDAAWLEHVRKEHAYLKHALMVEQRTSSCLSQVEEENKLLDALLLRSLERKLEYEQKVSSLQEKIFSLDTRISKASLWSVS